MPPESGGICGRLTKDLPMGCLQGGAVAAELEQGACCFFFFFTLITGPRRSLNLKLSEVRVGVQKTP